MMTDRFKAVVDIAARLAPETQDQLAAALEDALRHATQPVPSLAPDVRAAFERAMAEHAATLEYLKDK
ncbi:MAG TPA: hypothetical protein VLJ14_02735 [Ktedonobacterales bacterium]|nr:hypothetical protein [Ktedonobacterales bacterium]